MNEDRIIKTEYSDVMQKSYIDYAMSVIVARALPDVRDGLKPVQRRTLYDMHELGIKSDRPYRKCARIVGDTMGKYHPHGDSSIYEALVVMSQDFKKGLPLVDGHGNFGSIEGDGAAAMRYTEARLQKVSEEVLLADLDKDIVDFIPNFDETEKEPNVLPARIPHLLINGAEGIAVGMSTSIPPHNLGETIDAMKAYMKNPKLTVEDLLQIMPGPDFPTGGIVVNKDELTEIYKSGSGKIKLRGKVEVEKVKGGKEQLVITEIPYTMIGANIGKFLNDIGTLVETKKTTDIVDITNQSSKEGIRIVLELKKGADTELLTNMLYKKTRLEDTFGVNMLAVADGRPETLGLLSIFDHVIDFQFELNTRKYRTLLNKELDKKEIQEGLIKACEVIDLIIEILRGSRDIKMAKACLISGQTEGIAFRSERSRKQATKLRFTERQATAILEMRLYRLIGLEIEALMKEHEATMKHIARYSEILNNYDEMAKVIIKELDQYKKAYATPRKTVIENGKEAVFVEKKVEEMPVVFLMDRFGYCRTVDQSTYERNKEAADSESRYVISCKNTDRICIFTDSGKLHTAKVLDLPFGKFRDKAFPIDNYSNFDSGQEEMLCLVSMEELLQKKMLFVTKQGMGKIVCGQEYDVRTRTSMATKLSEGDMVLLAQKIEEEESQVVLWSESGYFLKFLTEEIPEKKKAAVGVRVMKLQTKEHIEGACLFAKGEKGSICYKEKNVELQRLRLTGRDQKGTKLRV
ncbi:MAG: DNA topoisomerase 4 subunit A [Lachnospiraceae bacterium]|jgi:DNA gyrase subunit A|nr:DNA topoisomerase 4 subunit A [Lachnospiraceae bacterium]